MAGNLAWKSDTAKYKVVHSQQIIGVEVSVKFIPVKRSSVTTKCGGAIELPLIDCNLLGLGKSSILMMRKSSCGGGGVQPFSDRSIAQGHRDSVRYGAGKEGDAGCRDVMMNSREALGDVRPPMMHSHRPGGAWKGHLAIDLDEGWKTNMT